MPKVSIIVPIYNAEKALRRCIESVLNQEFTDFELILMDDGSKDSSAAIIDEYAAKDSRIVPVHKPNSGVSDTRNMAIDMAEGEYVQFMDADDWITSDATKLLVRAAEDNDCQMVIADFYRVVGDNVSQKGDIDFEHKMSREEYADWMIRNPSDFYYGVLWNKLFRRNILEKYQIRMDRDVSWCEDFIFNMEYVLHTRYIYALKAPIYYYVKTEGSLASQGASLSNTVKMKMFVIDYYDNFYKQVYDETTYLTRKPEIDGFLFDFAGDGGSHRFMPGTTKLGAENVVVYDEAPLPENPVTIQYYKDALIERYIGVIAGRFNLEPKDVKVILFLKMVGRAGTTRDIGEYTGLAMVNITASIHKLRMRGLVQVSGETETEKKSRKNSYILTDDAANIGAALDQMLEDYDAVRFNGFSEEEKAAYLEMEKKALYNVRKVLIGE